MIIKRNETLESLWGKNLIVWVLDMLVQTTTLYTIQSDLKRSIGF